MRKKYENKTVFLKIQFSIDPTGQNRGVIGPNESFQKGMKTIMKLKEYDEKGRKRRNISKFLFFMKKRT